MRVLFMTVFVFWSMITIFAASASAQENSLGWIAYVQNGNIWTKELPDGTPHQLTTDGKNSSPRISPSGQWIVYTSSAKCDSPSHGCIPTQEELHLWVMERSSKHARQIAGCAPQWAPRNDALPCTETNGALSILYLPSFTRRVIVDAPQAAQQVSIGDAAWSWDEKALAFVRHDVIKAGAPLEIRVSLWWIDLETGAMQELLNQGEPSQDGLTVRAWTRDRRALLYFPIPYFANSIAADGLPLYSIPTRGGTPQPLIKAMIAYREVSNFSPTGDELALTAGSYRGSWTNKRIERIDFGRGTQNTLTGKNVAAISPTWSPNGKQFAYVAMPDEGDLVGGDAARVGLRKRRIWVMDADGSNQMQMTHDNAYRDENPQWSADGQFILFARIFQPDLKDAAQDRAELWLMRADGTNAQKVMDLADATAGDQNPPLWFGYYGSIGWDHFYDWWQPTPKTNLPITGTEAQDFTQLIFWGLASLALGAGVLKATQIKNHKSKIEN